MGVNGEVSRSVPKHKVVVVQQVTARAIVRLQIRVDVVIAHQKIRLQTTVLPHRGAVARGPALGRMALAGEVSSRYRHSARMPWKVHV